MYSTFIFLEQRVSNNIVVQNKRAHVLVILKPTPNYRETEERRNRDRQRELKIEENMKLGTWKNYWIFSSFRTWENLAEERMTGR